MDFELSEDQLELRTAVRDVLEGECPPSYVRRVAEQGIGADDLWATLASLDWPALALPTDLGGLDQTFVEVAIVVEELGRVAAPGPYLATVTQFAPLISEAGSAEAAKAWLGRVASGELTGTIAVDEGTGTWSPDDVAATATPEGEGYRLSGTKRFVIDGATADEVVVAARCDGGLGLWVVPCAELSATEPSPLDATTRFADLDLDGAWVPADRRLAAGDGAADATAALSRGLHAAITAAAVSTVGTCQRILDLVVPYVAERHQFGVPVGSFQAVKHKLVDMYRDIERARALGAFAALCIAEDDPRRATAAAMAKAAAGEAQSRVVEDGLQLFGGIGYTWEHDLHLYLRRAKIGELCFGSATRHRQAVARAFLATGSRR